MPIPRYTREPSCQDNTTPTIRAAISVPLAAVFCLLPEIGQEKGRFIPTEHPVIHADGEHHLVHAEKLTIGWGH